MTQYPSHMPSILPGGFESAGAPQVCDACRQPLVNVYYSMLGKAICERCSMHVHGINARNTFAFGPWILGAMAGFVVAVVGGFLWALIVKVSGLELGLLAIGIGMGVSFAVIKASGGRRGPSIQVLAIVLSIWGIIVGKGLIAAWVFWPQLQGQVPRGMDPTVARVFMFFSAPFLKFEFFDLLWYAFAIWEAYKIPRARPVSLAGPFVVRPVPVSTIAPGTTPSIAQLQFDTAMPIVDPAPPTLPIYTPPPVPPKIPREAP